MSMSNASEVVVQTEALTRFYGEGAVRVRALDAVSLRIGAGEMVAVMGPSGCGKSTLLNLLGALDRPTSGSVLIDGQDLARVRNLDRFRARTVGFVFQMHNLIPTLTALENVEVPLRGQGSGARQRRERAMEMLTIVGLADRARHLPGQLSGGQRQRAAIARALVNQPRLILADEPTGNLDSQSGAEIINLLTRLNHEQGTTILMVTHDRAIARCTQRILTMRDGRIVNEHHVIDALSEDLHALATSELGSLLIARDAVALAASPFVREGRLTRTAGDLADMLAHIARSQREDMVTLSEPTQIAEEG
jgi:ABC-type lipoprotein export system ATPase subunit